MIRIINSRVVIEKHDTHNKYYPQVISFSTVDEYPLSNSPSATIKIIQSSNLNGVATVSHVEFDDIVRLQVSTKYHPQEKDVWVTIFHGRVQNQSKTWGTNNDIEFECNGYINEAFYKIITVDTTWANVDATVILQAVDSYMSRVKYNSNYAVSGQLVAEYNVSTDQNFIVDIYKEMEKLSGYKRKIGVEPVYDAAGNLQTCYLRWEPISSTATTKYAIREGTPRIISATFDVVGDDVFNFYHMHGGNNSAGSPYAGSAQNLESVTEYDARHKSETNTWIKSNQLCTNIAQVLADDNALPYIAGQVVLEGTPDAQVGDMVTVYIPSIEAKGAQIDGVYTVYRVVHSFSKGAFTTTLDLGRIKKTGYDYIAKSLTQVIQTCYKNQIKK